MSEALTPGVLSAKDYELKALELVNSAGQTVDLRKIFKEMQIYQDLYSSVMNGNIFIEDGKDIFNNFYLCGNEYLRVSIDKSSLGLPLERFFRIYKTTERKPTKDAAQSYILHFCSDEMILSNSMRISKAYKSSTASDIVKDVLLNYLKISEDKIGKFENSGGTYDFVVPGYRPLEAIQWAVARSFDYDPKFCYFFYESTRGFNYQSLQTLYKQKPYKKLKYELKNIDPDPSTNRDSVDKFVIVNDFDMLTSISNGAFASKLLAVDIFSQKFTEYNYSVQIAEAQKSLLNKFKPVNLMNNQNGEPQTVAFDSYFTTYVQLNDTTSEKENSIDKWMMPRALHMSLINAFRFKVVLPGDIAMQVGDIVEYEFPKFVSADESGKELDEFRNAKYLVTSINHKFSEDTFETIVELSADSFASEIPAAKDLSKIVKKKT